MVHMYEHSKKSKCAETLQTVTVIALHNISVGNYWLNNRSVGRFFWTSNWDFFSGNWEEKKEAILDWEWGPISVPVDRLKIS